MSDLDAAACYLQELLPDVVSEVEHWPSSTARTLPHFIASLLDLAENDLMGDRVLLANPEESVLSDWRGSPITIYAMTETRALLAKTQRFIEFLRERLRHLAAVSEH